VHCITWVQPTLCLASLNELVVKIAKKSAKLIELAGEAFQKEELKSSLLYIYLKTEA